MAASPISFDEQHVDALRELTNIGAGNASIALERLIGRPVEVSVPEVELVTVAEATAAAGRPDEDRYGIVVGVEGDFAARVLILIDPRDAAPLYEGFGLVSESLAAHSMLAELGNILCAYYVGSLARAAGLEAAPAPPQLVEDMLAAIFGAALIGDGLASDPVLLMKSAFAVADRECEFKVLLLPQPGALETLFKGLGL